MVGWPPHQIGDNGEGQGGGEVSNRIDAASLDGSVDDRAGPGVDVIAESTQRAWHQPMGNKLAAAVMVGTVAVEGGAA